MIPYVMDDTKSLTDLATDTSNGLGRLAECLKLEVTEGLDGSYTAVMTIPTAAYNSGLVHKGGIIKAKANNTDDPQLFRIVNFRETLSTGLIECNMEHICYDLNKAILCPTDGLYPFYNLEQICNMFNNNNVNTEFYPADVFTFITDSPATLYNHGWVKPMTPRQLFYAEDGICNWSGVQIKWDNLTVGINARRGSDKSLSISYGKNLLDFVQDEDISEVYDGIIGYCYNQNWSGGRSVTSVPIPLVENTTPQHLLLVDLSEKTSSSADPPEQWAVTNWATTWLSEHTIDTIKVAYDVDLVSLAEDGEYDKVKELEFIELGDTVTVKNKSGDISAVVTEVTFDSLTERYTDIKLGNYLPSLTDTIIELVNKTK